MRSIGRILAPVFRPLGFEDWRVTTALITGFTAKEAVVSTLGILTGAGTEHLSAALSGLFTPLSAVELPDVHPALYAVRRGHCGHRARAGRQAARRSDAGGRSGAGGRLVRCSGAVSAPAADRLTHGLAGMGRAGAAGGMAGRVALAHAAPPRLLRLLRRLHALPDVLRKKRRQIKGMRLLVPFKPVKKPA